MDTASDGPSKAMIWPFCPTKVAGGGVGVSMVGKMLGFLENNAVESNRSPRNGGEFEKKTNDPKLQEQAGVGKSLVRYSLPSQMG